MAYKKSATIGCKGEDEDTDGTWIHLKEPKAFSRILYPNPVCFLCTPSCLEEDYSGNVMIISWLTAINNEGGFVMSMNRRRNSARYMASNPGRDFTLCVATADMEAMVLDVGRVSGRMNSKFCQEDETKSPDQEEPVLSRKDGLRDDNASLTKKQRHQQRQDALRRGVPGLVRVPLGSGHENPEMFCIKGTVAHLHCRTYMVVDDENVDKDHYIIYSRVVDAYCRSSYWQRQKKQFLPTAGKSPYLTFLGSQVFGRVVGDR